MTDRLAIDSKIWVYEGFGYTAGLRKGHWTDYVIVGETRVSWIISSPKYRDVACMHRKIRKSRDKDQSRTIWVASEVERDRMTWVITHYYKIADRVRALPRTFEVFDAIAELIGYEERFEG